MSDKMQIATIWLDLNDKSNIQLHNVTPPEAQFLRRQFGIKVQGSNEIINPITHLKVTGEIDRPFNKEMLRLIQRFGETRVTEVFPGENPSFKLTFKEIGMVETEDASPKVGKIHAEYPPLDKIPRGDDGTAEGLQVAMGLKEAKQVSDDQSVKIAKLEGQVAALMALLQQQQVKTPTPTAPPVPINQSTK